MHGNDFSTGGAKLVKNNQDNKIQNITLCNMYFSKKLGAFSRTVVIKITLQSVRLLLSVSYKKNWGAGYITCSPNNFVGGSSCCPCLQVPALMSVMSLTSSCSRPRTFSLRDRRQSRTLSLFYAGLNPSTVDPTTKIQHQRLVFDFSTYNLSLIHI